MNLTLIVGTGRCGSTMLWRILHDHPSILSVNEFFTTVSGAAHSAEIPAEDMSGDELWQLLAKPGSFFEDVTVGDENGNAKMPRIPYRGKRFAGSRSMPLICCRVLSMLTEDPDELFDQLAREVPTWPIRSAADQYRALFSCMARILGRQVITERSAVTLKMVGLLHEQFPEARFVNVVRDGPDCAFSMSRHPGFRLTAIAAQTAQAAGLPPSAPWADIGVTLPREWRGLFDPPYDASRIMSYDIPLSLFGGKWSQRILDGLAALNDLPSGAWISLKYEDILRDPHTELARLADFIDADIPEQWLAAAHHLVDPRRVGSAAAHLDPQALESLQKACEPGTEAIRSIHAV